MLESLRYLRADVGIGVSRQLAADAAHCPHRNLSHLGEHPRIFADDRTLVLADLARFDARESTLLPLARPGQGGRMMRVPAATNAWCR